MKSLFLFLMLTLCFLSAIAQSSKKKVAVIGEEVSYISNGVTLKGYVAYDSSIHSQRPGIVVVHEWWGCEEYVRMRARMLAELGYIAIAADIYGNGLIATDPKMAGENASTFYKNPELANERIEAAISKLKSYPQTNSEKIAAIGYCFGGSMLLNAAKMGMNVNGVVSFHGSLNGIQATKGSTKAKILVCHGGADKFISAEDVINFKQNLDSFKVAYQFITYQRATHAFTNPNATAIGKKFDMPIRYNEEGDKKSWQDMKIFLNKLFK